MKTPKPKVTKLRRVRKGPFPKWYQIADQARGEIAHGSGWQPGVDVETQIAAQICTDAERAKRFIGYCARGRTGRDIRSLRIRLVLEARMIYGRQRAAQTKLDAAAAAVEHRGAPEMTLDRSSPQA